ncbi:glutathione S-transferase C-terminal domain-containing protein [Vibrio parahaemolyticus]|uniref:hypothetical protein n=1 Tax=Vibrio parahaemolyticus TaxID=670 RepID=UPI0011219CBD|nr:hypothetical protein [Vibrio parahaemolyticus]MBE4137532.1 hypothetical protein [Vibrio parahaemolyticus]MCG0034490.1 hypothetical protein [Vibrio parahaemolyticus]MCX8946389.1 glutathione S-transferase C-terminal domain-containing protein [Vibrio parahaemolyticus]MDL2016159.1 glutathione S-transferase C-terminal domain-containing protein [Vibrio parahaemolyticus]MDL2039190.1 glutathione S-transferase C-terminal domain-containing protein [Vibrio parahaemolyticus]
MDIEVFTNERLKFARFFYSEGIKPFKRIITSIDDELPPYEPVYSESGEPQFMSEWAQANDGIEAVGLASISMLSSALQLYMNGWLDRIEARPNVKPVKRKGNSGWFHALKNAIAYHGVDFSQCPVNVDVLEQMVLARNRTQHSEDITSNSVTHLERDLKRFPSPIFVNPSDIAMTNNWFNWVRVYVDESIFNDVTDTVEDFCRWLEKQYVSLVNVSAV